MTSIMTRLGWIPFLTVLTLSSVRAFTSSCPASKPSRFLFSVSPDVSAEEALARTQAHLNRLQRRQKTDGPPSEDLHPQQRQSIVQETLYQEYILQPANSLKQELERRKLSSKGRKPDLARRLAQHDLKTKEGLDSTLVVVEKSSLLENDEISDVPYPVKFAGIPLSRAAATALHQAGFLDRPSPIQVAAFPAMTKGESVLLHAPTGSGKTIAYVLPITEFLWRATRRDGGDNDGDRGVAVICTPTRELAAQVAGVASTLAPPGTVRLLSHPSNLMTDGSKDRRDRAEGTPRILVGSARCLVHSLYGNDEYPAPPTPKPLALQFLKGVRVLVLDEVDRLLAASGRHGPTSSHEKPAAILTAAVARHTLGRAQIVAASATVGRPLRRELARVLGLPPPQGPRAIVAPTGIAEGEPSVVSARESKPLPPQGSSRWVTIPKNVRHYLAPVPPKRGDDDDENATAPATTSSGQLIIQAYQVIQNAVRENDRARILMVLTRGFGISTQHVIGALRHFNCHPRPQSLLDALQENALEGTDHMMQVHRQVSGATGVGQSSPDRTDAQNTGHSSSLWVTGEDTIRGLHLDGLDVVLVVGRPRGPDEYTHIAGRTGRAGRSGKVVAVISEDQAPLLRGWETILKIEWQTYGKEN